MAAVLDLKRDAFTRVAGQCGATGTAIADARQNLSGLAHLAEQASEPNPFYENWFLRPSLERFDPQRNCKLLVVRRADRTCGVLPLVRRHRYSKWPVPHFGNWTHPNLFLGTPLVVEGAERMFWRETLRWIDSHAGPALFLHLHRFGLGGPVHRALERVAIEDGRPLAVVGSGERALHATTLDPDAYLGQALPKRKRKDLDRRYRRLQELSAVRCTRETGTARLDEWIESFLALEASGWKGEAGSALACDPATERLFRDALRGAASEGKLLRMALTLDDRPIAMLSTFLAPPGAFGFKTAFDEACARYSPGFLLEREFIRAWPELGLAWCDSCARPGHSVMDRIWTERRRIGRVSIGIGGPVRRRFFEQIVRRETARTGLDRARMESAA